MKLAGVLLFAFLIVATLASVNPVFAAQFCCNPLASGQCAAGYNCVSDPLGCDIGGGNFYACRPVGAVCDNLICQSGLGEDCNNCPEDCGLCPGCGDNICDSSLNENCNSCSQDCGSCIDCPLGTSWNAGTGECVAQNCGASTTTQDCAILSGSPSANYYCSRGSTGIQYPAPGICCPAGTYWNGVVCTGGSTDCRNDLPAECTFTPTSPAAITSYLSVVGVDVDVGCVNTGPSTPIDDYSCCDQGYSYGDPFNVHAYQPIIQQITGPTTIQAVTFCQGSTDRFDIVCGAADNRCPTDYSTKQCNVCDPDCHIGAENTPAACSDCMDNDNDGLLNFNDVSPGAGPTQSCNIADLATCQALVPGSVTFKTQQFDPSDPSTTYTSATALQPGDATHLRADSDGIIGLGSLWCGVCNGGYHWDAFSSMCMLNANTCAATASPTLSSFTSQFVPAGQNTAPATAVVTLTGTVAPGLSAGFIIDDDANDANGVLKNCSLSSCNLNLPNTPAGTYTYYARVEDDCVAPGAHAYPPAGPISFTVIPVDPPPTYTSPIIASLTPVWNGADAHFVFDTSDNVAGSHVVLDFGDGSPPLDEIEPTPGIVSQDFIHTYAPGSYTATLTITDTKPQTVIYTEPVNAVGLPCVTGSAAGNATYDPADPDQCCWQSRDATSSCAELVAGAYNCFSASTCSVNTGNICSGASSSPPPDLGFIDRDTSQARCESNGGTCALLNWSDANHRDPSLASGACCGDDVGEFAAVNVYPGPLGANNNACCQGAGMCYTTAFNPGGWAGCFGGVEAGFCADNNDNDCDGDIDGADFDCYGTNKVFGYVTPASVFGWNSSNVPTAYLSGVAAGQQINLVTGYYEFLSPVPGPKELYVTANGYETKSVTFTLGTNSQVQYDFTLAERTCNQFCENSQGYCDASCIGVGPCQPTAPELSTLHACDPPGSVYGLKKGTEVVLGNNGTHLNVGVCCAVPASWRTAPAVTAGSAALQGIDTLVKYTRLVTLNGETYKLVISTW